ncbi:MAG TPA: glycosyltransferase family 2 protein [Chthoniobacteraceae bacterium]|nr:glycosyltransferase family 2 protein [Chthoniobacteraceae bacterium]
MNSLIDPQPMISAVIPAFNEAAGIEHAIATIGDVLRQCATSHEIIVVDDGSRDDTFEKVRALSQHDASLRGIRLSRNFGKESAILAGLQAARGAAVITIDADLQHPPALIPEMIRRWQAGARVVHAVKRSRSRDSLWARQRAALVNGFLTWFGGIEMENASDFKLLDRVAVNAVVRLLRERHRFYRGLAKWIGFAQETIPFDVAERGSGGGKWSLRALLNLGITAIVSFTTAPLRIVVILGTTTLCFAIAVAADTLWSVYRHRAVSGFATLEITILLIGSFIMISLGIVGEYIAKIYEEAKARPSFLEAARCGFEDENSNP